MHAIDAFLLLLQKSFHNLSLPTEVSMMSVTISEVSRASLTAIGKRKRAVVNYAELSDMMDLDMDENEAEEEQDVSDNDVPEGDSVYGSRKVSHTCRSKAGLDRISLTTLIERDKAEGQEAYQVYETTAKETREGVQIPGLTTGTPRLHLRACSC